MRYDAPSRPLHDGDVNRVTELVTPTRIELVFSP